MRFPIYRHNRIFLGRTVSQSCPGFGDSTLISSNLYNTVGQLTSTTSISTRSTCSIRLKHTHFLYDSLGDRVTTVSDRNFNGVADLAGPDLALASTRGYDTAGRLAWSVGEDGVRTEYRYGVSPEGGEVRTTVRAAGTDCAVTNTTVSYRDGATRATYLNGVLKATEVHEPFAETAYEGPNGTASPRWTRTETDFLGRTIAETHPGFRGAFLVTSNAYDTANRLVSTRTYSQPSQLSQPSQPSSPTPLTFTSFTYDSLGDRVTTVSDRNFNGVVDLAGPDLVSSNETRYVKLGGDWWRESRQFSYHRDNSAAPQLMSTVRTRLTGLNSESVSVDLRGNATTRLSVRDRDAATETTVTRYPTSTTPVTEVSSNGLLVASTSQTGVTTTYGYDELERRVSVTDGRGNTTRTVYDAQGRVAKTIDALGHETTYTYDALGRQTSITDPLGHTVTTAYDAEGRVLSQRGATYPVDYTYDAYGNKVAMTTYRDEALTNGDTTRWLYDEPSGCMTNKLYADGKGPSYSYTPDGKLARRVWARGIVTDYTYDNAGQLILTTYSDTTPTITMAYDRVGNLTEATTVGVVTNLYAYDIGGNCTNEWQNDFHLTRFYDTLGRSTGYAINGIRQTTIAYDTYGRIGSMSLGLADVSTAQNANGEFTWTYLPNSDLKASLQYPNGLTASWTYDANNQLLQVRNATPTNVISQFDYTYDAAGRRTAIAKTGTAFGDLSGSVDAYTYNARSELTSARRTKNDQPIPGFSEDFDYDPIGNRRSSATYNEKGEAQTSTYQANNLNQYTSRTTPGYAAVRGEADPNAFVSVNGNEAYRLGSYYFGSDLFDNTSAGGLANLETCATLAQTAVNGDETEDLVSSVTNQVYLAQSPEAFAYDDDGNQTLITTKTGLWRVTYNGENRPILWVRDSDNTTLTMSYDHMGRRRAKNDQRFFYDGYLQVADNDGNAYTWDCTEAVATRPLVWNRDDSSDYYTHDGNKNVNEAIAANGALVAHYEYAPFGALSVRRGESAATNPWRFSSEYAEDDTATVYYNYRHYEPVTGRWMCRDSIEEEGGVAIYLFCNNNCFVLDYAGMSFFDDILICISDTRAGRFMTCMGDCVSDNDPIERIINKLIFQLTTGVHPKAVVAGILDKAGKHHMASLVRAMSRGKASWGTSLESVIALAVSEPAVKQMLRKVGDAVTRVNTAYGLYMLQVEAACAGACCAKEDYEKGIKLPLDINSLMNEVIGEILKHF